MFWVLIVSFGEVMRLSQALSLWYSPTIPRRLSEFILSTLKLKPGRLAVRVNHEDKSAWRLGGNASFPDLPKAHCQAVKDT